MNVQCVPFIGMGFDGIKEFHLVSKDFAELPSDSAPLHVLVRRGVELSAIIEGLRAAVHLLETANWLAGELDVRSPSHPTADRSRQDQCNSDDSN